MSIPKGSQPLESYEDILTKDYDFYTFFEALPYYFLKDSPEGLKYYLIIPLSQYLIYDFRFHI